MKDFKIRLVSKIKKIWKNFISEKITEIVEGIDSNRNFKNEKTILTIPLVDLVKPFRKMRLGNNFLLK